MVQLEVAEILRIFFHSNPLSFNVGDVKSGSDLQQLCYRYLVAVL
jgi:hypothetical protein